MRGARAIRYPFLFRLGLMAGCFCTVGTVQAGHFLGDLTWQEARQHIPLHTVVVPFAAGAKEHGPHLPMNTDAKVMQYLLDAAVAEADVVVVPPILHGWFPGFRSYPGTEVADATVFQRYLEQVALSLLDDGAQRIVFLNMGISRASGLPISIVARDLRANHDVHTLVISWDDLEGPAAEAVYEQERGGHADEGETSVMLYLNESAVRKAQLTKDYRQVPKAQIGYAPGTFDVAAEAGLFGDATLATKAKGKVILQDMRQRWLLALQQFAQR